MCFTSGDEFPELFEFCFGGNSHNDLPEHVKKEWNKMPLPDQTGFVERLRGKATVHHAMGGDLDDAFLRELNDNIRSGLTEMLTKESKSFRPRLGFHR